MSKQMVTCWIEKGEVKLLKEKFNTDNQSEDIRLAVMECLAKEEAEKVKTLFPYIGKKPPRIGRKVVNDINGNLTNLYMVIRDSLSEFVSVVMKLPYSEVMFQKFKEEDLKSVSSKSELERAVAYFYVSFSVYIGRIDNPLYQISTTTDTNRAKDYQKSIPWILQLFKRLQSVEILNRDFREVLKSYDSESVFVYADCPYLGTGHYYENFFTPQDHKDLSEMLKSHKGKFVLSSKAKKDLRKLYRSNKHYVLNFEDAYRLPDKRHREQLILNF